MDGEGGESGCGGGGVVNGERCGGLGEEKENRVSDERERERGIEVELGILILLKGIIVISCIQWGGRGSPCQPPFPPVRFFSPLLSYEKQAFLAVAKQKLRYLYEKKTKSPIIKREMYFGLWVTETRFV